jgi:hypothetical protein
MDRCGDRVLAESTLAAVAAALPRGGLELLGGDSAGPS